MTYEEIKGIVTQNSNITAKEFYEEVKKGGKTDTKICDLFIDIIRSGEPDILNDRDFLKIVKLLMDSDIKIIKDTASKSILDYAIENKQDNVVKILLGSNKFNEEEKLNTLHHAIVQGNVQEFEVFLDYINHARILDAFNTAPRNESTDLMRVLLDNKRFTEEEKVQALSHASIDGDLPKVRLLLKYMKGIPEDGIRNLLEIIEEGKLSLREKLKIDSEFKVDFNNSDHCKYLSNRVIIALLRSAINKKEKQSTPDVEENGAGYSSSSTETVVLNGNFVSRLFAHIARSISSSSFDLQRELSQWKVNLQSKCEQDTALGNALLEHAIKDENLNVIKPLLQNGVTIINAIGQEGRYYVSKIGEDKSILCSVVSYIDDSNAEILDTLLQNINAEQLKLNPESELYRLYQQLKDDAFCTAVAESNSVAATVLIQNDQEKIAPHESATNKKQGAPHIETNSAFSNSNENVGNKTVSPISTNNNDLNHDSNNETSVATGASQTATPSVEENIAGPSNSNENVDSRPVDTLNGQLNRNNENEIPVATGAGQTAVPSVKKNKANGFIDAQFFMPNEKETQYKENKENFYASLRKDAVGVIITGLFIAAAVMVPSVAGAVVCSIVAVLVAVYTGLHVKDSTLPSYREMEENRVAAHNQAYHQA